MMKDERTALITTLMVRVMTIAVVLWDRRDQRR